MGDIRIISASAGSGKTWQLADELHRALTDESEPAQPEAVLAMTFTTKAAGELQQRARGRLIERGEPDKAQRLAAARIGTVNSVCGQLVKDFAFELGLSPKLEVLDEVGSAELLAATLSQVIADGTDSDLEGLGRRLNARGFFGDTWDWQADVGRVVELARSNGIEAQQLEGFAERSWSGVQRLFDAPAAEDGEALDRALETAIRDFLQVSEDNGDNTKSTRDVRREARAMLTSLRVGSAGWGKWAKLAKSSPAKKSKDAYEPVQAAAAAHDIHPRLRADLERAVRLVFDLAGRVLDRYQERKRAHGLIDFVDQEALSLKLLGQQGVREHLSGDLQLVFVDEFQDTSPIQLAIFLRLAGIAQRSIWVGDQKQSIYAFRGTDPSLMDAVIERVLERGDADEALMTLEHSWRSRPPLVDYTSDVFAPPFMEHGIPEAQVRLTAAEALGPDDPALGEIAEVWALDGKNKGDQHAAVATAVALLLADQDVRVRDQVTGESRGVVPEDVAILCRSNQSCADVAAALEAQGIRAALAPADLVAPLETRTVLAGVRLWIDGGDALAATELARILDDPADGTRWLSAIAGHGARDAFKDLGVVAAIRAAREARPLLGTIEIIDEVMGLLDAPSLCRRWGNAAVRMSNLERLRAHAVEYAQRCRSEAIGCTPVGLLAELQSGDERRFRGTEPAVAPASLHVSTWHGAKGLEWPITVLYELEGRDPKLAAMGLHVETDRERIELDDPLAERWIRYWPWPYGAQSAKIPILDRLAAAHETQRAASLAEREELRLLYVGWTRARDRIVLATRSGNLGKGTLERLDLTAFPEHAVRREGTRREAVAREVTPEPTYEPREPQPHPPAFLTPSAIHEESEVGEPVVLGDRFIIEGQPDWRHLGEAVHGFLAADRPAALDDELRVVIAQRLLDAWGVAAAMSARHLLECSARMETWIHSTWPDATCHRELQMAARDAGATITRGVADLVLETSDGELVIIDHKSYPGSPTDAVREAAGYGGQLNAYAHLAERAFGRPVTQAFVHMPIVGVAVPVQIGMGQVGTGAERIVSPGD